MQILRVAASLVVWIIVAISAGAQAWVPLVNQPNPNLGLGNPLLLTDGTVIMHEACGSTWWRLTPDQFGDYVNGTWKRIASLPAGYAPLYFGSAVLPDGRVIMEGGEYNSSKPGRCRAVWTNKGAIYDPKTNTWTAMTPPPGWSTIGDAQSVVLANGTYMQANCCTKQSALLDATTLTWTLTGRDKFDVNDEEGWTLLPDGTVLTVDAYVFKYEANGMNYEIYNPATKNWKSGPASGTMVQLWDSYPDAQLASDEVGPMVLRPDGTVFATGANGAPGNGNGHTAIYDTKSQTWTVGPNFPDDLDVADGPAALLPDGKVLVQTSPGIFGIGSKFFVWDGSTLTNVTAGNTDAPNIPSYIGNMLVLPTGQILWTDFGDVWVYQHGGNPNPEWKPQISFVPSDITRGKTYVIAGSNFNGFSQGAAYGDDAQAATNYPLVRFTNRETGNVYYARTHDHSTMAIAYTGIASTNFDVPAKAETGLSDLVVVANGIASSPVTVNVH
ncbi:MAG TPA: kelch repeat-containing protein [Candidatus Sulfotelmatobacter sp.]